jgi:hypothetical protein
VILGVEDVTIAVGDAFTKMAGVSALDADGSDITHLVMTSGIVNVNRAGFYEVDYYVTGANGVTVTVTRTITVVDNARINGPESLPTSVLIDTAFDPYAGVTATDYDDTDLTDQIVLEGSIVKPDGTIDTSAAGTFDITYRVTGKSGASVTYVLSLTIYAPGNAVVLFSGANPETPNVLDLVLGMPLSLTAIASAKDYDGADLSIDAIEYDSALDALVVNNVFNPTVAGTYEFRFKATGQNGVQSTTTLTVTVVRQGVVIDGVYIPVLPTNINNDGKPWNTTLIYTELKGLGEYGVLVLVDAHGRVVAVRDAYAAGYSLTNPIKQGTPAQIRGIANAVGWTGANIFNGILGPQGTPGGIPEGGFAIYFNRDNVSGTTHPTRLLGLLYGREFGAYVEVVGLEIPNYNPPTNDARILGADDVVLYSDMSFDPLDRITGEDFDGTELQVSVVFNNVDLTRPSQGITDYTKPGFADGYYAVVYAVTGANGYTVHVTRRVTVLPAIEDAVIEGVADAKFAVGQAFDPLQGITATDYDNTDLTSQIVVEGTVDTQTPGVYTLTYKVTGKSNNQVSVIRTVTIAADAYFTVGGERTSSVYLNETFDPWNHLLATDHNGVDLTSQITLESPVYVNQAIVTSTAGTFDLTYRVTGESGQEVVLVLTLTVMPIPNATVSFTVPESHKIFINTSIDLNGIVSAKDYDGTVIPQIELAFDVAYDPIVLADVFTPTAAGVYTFTYSVIGINGVQVFKTLTVTVYETGVTIEGVAIPILQDNVNLPSGKPADTIMVFTELAGMGEYGVLVIVDAHGRIVMVRDAFGEQMDIHNPFKTGNPTFPTNLSGLPNFKTYDAYTGGLWTTWTKGGADTFEGLLGPQGTPGGIPEGGYAIYFQNGTTSRPLGLTYAREFGAKVEIFGLTIPNVNTALDDQDAVILGASDIEIAAGTVFDPLAGITAQDHDGTPLSVSVVFNNVNVDKPVITPQPSRVVNTVAGREAYAQGWYSVVYAATGANGYTVQVSRRVTVR